LTPYRAADAAGMDDERATGERGGLDDGARFDGLLARRDTRATALPNTSCGPP
jgi:hypothetical protein